MINELVFWLISFVFLFFSVFWILVLKLSEGSFNKVMRIKRFPHVTLIVPTKNGAERLVRTVNKIHQLNYPKDRFDIIIAPNNCTDNTVEIAKALAGKGIRVLEVSVPKGKFGKAYAFNRALKIAKGEIVACLDDDSLISPNALRMMVPLFDESEKIAAIVPGYKVYKPKNFLERIQHIEYLVASITKKLLESVGALYFTHGVCCLYRKDIILRLGGFDERSLTEDIEMAVRLNKLGYDVRSRIECINYTEVPNNFVDLHRQRLRWTRGYYTTMLKHRDMLFSKKHGFLGMFILPIVIFVMAPLTMFATIYFVYSLLRRIVVETLSAWSVPEYALSNLTRLPSFLSISSLWILMAVLLLLIIYFIYKAQIYMKERWKYPAALLVFITVYQSFLAAYWTIALFYELFNASRKW